jgi:hypothetical protein
VAVIGSGVTGGRPPILPDMRFQSVLCILSFVGETRRSSVGESKDRYRGQIGPATATVTSRIPQRSDG